MVDSLIDIASAVGLALLAAACFFGLVALGAIVWDWLRDKLIWTCVCDQPDCGGGCKIQHDPEVEQHLRDLQTSVDFEKECG